MTTTTSPPVETFRRISTTVDTMLWDGTPERARHIKAWVGYLDSGEPKFLLPSEATGVWEHAHVWNDQEGDWFPAPVGHRVVRGRLGEFYSISPDAIKATYRRARLAALWAAVRRWLGGGR
jgi:hypothetical protein